jgi:hypothetical protein
MCDPLVCAAGDDGAVDAAGIERLINDLGLDPTDKVLVRPMYL